MLIGSILIFLGVVINDASGKSVISQSSGANYLQNKKFGKEAYQQSIKQRQYVEVLTGFEVLNSTSATPIHDSSKSSLQDSSDVNRELASAAPPVSSLSTRVTFSLFVEPGNGTFSPSALTVFARCSDPVAKIYYTLDGTAPTLQSQYLTYDTPYIGIYTPFGAYRTRRLRIICAILAVDSQYTLSPEIKNDYYVENTDRPGSFGYLVPGIESSGYFLRVGLEMAAAARAQVAGGQEFADFDTSLGVGTYANQIRALPLLEIDPDLGGFEGGFSANTNEKYYGYLVPHFNGKKFFGKVVRVDLMKMENITRCQASVRMEFFNSNTGDIEVTGEDESVACVTILDLGSLHPRAVGFMKGFTGVIEKKVYAFLSPGQYDVVVRMDLENFGLATTRIIPLGDFDRTLGGYAGGFVDSTWACFNPFRTFYGPVGGVRSNLTVDAHHLRPYFSAVFACVNHSAWTDSNSYAHSIRTFDMGDVDASLRGFSNTIRIGRYIYLAPFEYGVNLYSSRLIRFSCGDKSIIDTIDEMIASGGTLRDLILTLDLTQKDLGLTGFSGIYHGIYISMHIIFKYLVLILCQLLKF